MDKEKILELAAQNESDLYSERVWAFDQEALIAFAASVIEAGQADERERIKKIIEQVGVQGNHNEWFDCVDVILERIEE